MNFFSEINNKAINCFPWSDICCTIQNVTFLGQMSSFCRWLHGRRWHGEYEWMGHTHTRPSRPTFVTQNVCITCQICGWKLVSQCHTNKNKYYEIKTLQ